MAVLYFLSHYLPLFLILFLHFAESVDIPCHIADGRKQRLKHADPVKGLHQHAHGYGDDHAHHAVQLVPDVNPDQRGQGT